MPAALPVVELAFPGPLPDRLVAAILFAARTARSALLLVEGQRFLGDLPDVWSLRRQIRGVSVLRWSRSTGRC